MPLDILYQDNHLIVVNKLATQLVQADKTGDDPLLEEVRAYLKDAFDKPGNVFVGLPHRLDRPVSGIVVLARTSKSLARLCEMFQEKTIQKTYWAVVEKKKEIHTEATLKDFLTKNEKLNKSFVSKTEQKNSKLAELSYKIACQTDRYYCLEVLPKTGRHHQIRVQLANMGTPIKGDLKYGAKRSNPDGSIHLHARKIAFIHPVKKEYIEIEAPVPSSDTLWKYFTENAKP
jgi:23S rRNA pseudouridine1911/1915/1917 synthase